MHFFMVTVPEHGKLHVGIDYEHFRSSALCCLPSVLVCWSLNRENGRENEENAGDKTAVSDAQLGDTTHRAQPASTLINAHTHTHPFT